MSKSLHEKLAYRLADILTMLNTGESLSVDDLAQKYQVSRRTIMRDIDERLAFLPLEKQAGHYRLSVNYLGQLSYKDIRNFAQISGIAKLYPNLDVSFLREILDERATQVYSVKGYTFEDATQFEDLISQIKQSIQEQREISFVYKGGSKQVKPYQIVHHRGCWYLAAVKDDELKAYRLSRMSKLSILAQKFDVQTEFVEQLKQSESIWFGKNKVEVILKVNATVAAHFAQRKLLPEQKLIKELDNGDLLLSSVIVDEKQIFPLVRYWLPHLKIISPDGWQERLEDGLKDYLGMGE